MCFILNLVIFQNSSLVLRSPHLGHVHVRGSQGFIQGGFGDHEVHAHKRRKEALSHHVRNFGRSKTPSGNKKIALLCLNTK